MDPAIKKIRDTFIRQLGDEMRADGFDDKRIAWLLGPEAVAANGNEPKRSGRPVGSDVALVRERIIATLKRRGPMTYSDLASEFGSTARNVQTWVRMNEPKGLVKRTVRYGRGNKTTVEAL